MIYDVKKIKIRALAAQQARIVPEAIEQPVGLEEPPARRPTRRETTTHRWSETRRLDCPGIILLQIMKQHVGHEVHARPVLFPVIANGGKVRHSHQSTFSPVLTTVGSVRPC